MANLASLPEFLALQNASFDAVGIVDSQGHYVWVNDTSIRLFGYSREEILGSHFRSHLLPDDVEAHAMTEALNGGPSVEVRRVQCKNGSVRTMRTELTPLGEGQVLIHAIDLTPWWELRRIKAD